jgi:hypothetical protein
MKNILKQKYQKYRKVRQKLVLKTNVFVETLTNMQVLFQSTKKHVYIIQETKKQ